MIPIAWYLAYWLRFNMDSVPPYMLERATSVLPILLIAQGLVFWYFGLYRGVWRFASIPDLVRIVKALGMGVLVAAILVFFIYRMEGIPRTIFPLYGILLLLLIASPRLLYRWFREHQVTAVAKSKVLIVGAGPAGELLARELLRTPEFGYKPVAFIDDDPTKIGSEIHGVRVVGTSSSIPDQTLKLDIDYIFLVVPAAGSRNLRRIVEFCESSAVPFRMLPFLSSPSGDHSVYHAMRDVSIEDLLGRDAVSLDWDSIRQGVAEKVVLVSGGGGSIGSELTRQLAQLNLRQLIVLDNNEFNLYTVEMELRRQFPHVCVVSKLVDVCDSVDIDRVFRELRPDIVFHAAAYKHVPMLEEQARQAVRNNVFGTRTLANAAIDNGTQAFVLISTDKAVNPTNVMGASKRVAELVCQQCHVLGDSTRFITVRFGNVLDSAGSVIPLFRQQIAQGGPVTVTHPEVKRYFMTIPEACQLILEAGAIGRGGDIFVLDMGDPIEIVYLAEQMIVLTGRTPGEDIEIVFTGLRPGEKLVEELFHFQEQMTATGMDKLLLVRGGEMDWVRFKGNLDSLSKACEASDEKTVKSLLQEIVPEYQSEDSSGGISQAV